VDDGGETEVVPYELPRGDLERTLDELIAG
jgi:hypothetical protein